MWNYFDVFFHNAHFIRKLPTTNEFLNLCKRNTQTFQSQSPQIIRLSHGIVSFNDDPYVKVQKIHDWIISHIYYDKDVVKNGIYLQMNISALESLLNKRCVCSGYSNLLVAILRSVGIPAIGVTCITKSSFVLQEEKENSINHEICMAYVKSKWMIIDATWDSSNVFENGKFITSTNNVVSRKYYDCDLKTISQTHRLVGCILE